MNDYKFGNFIYALRSEKGISQEELGEIAGVKNSTVSKWENGKSIPPMKTLKILSSYFDISVEELLNGERKQEEESVSAQPIIQQVYIPYSPPTEPPNSKKVRIWMIVLCAFTFASLFIAAKTVLAFSNAITFEKNMWIFNLFLPIPIASIVLGFHFKKKHYKVTKNIVIGFIVFIYMFIFGTASYFTENIYMYEPEYFYEIEQKIDFDFPDNFGIRTTVDEAAIIADDGGKFDLTDTWVMYEDVTDEEQIEYNVKNSDKWVYGVNDEVYNLLPTHIRPKMTETTYTLVYNETLNTFNAKPEASGKYHYITIFFSLDYQYMTVYEYDMVNIV